MKRIIKIKAVDSKRDISRLDSDVQRNSEGVDILD